MISLLNLFGVLKLIILNISQKSLENMLYTSKIFLLEWLPVRLLPIQSATDTRKPLLVFHHCCSCII